MLTELHGAQRLFEHNRKQGIAELKRIFRAGKVPDHLLNDRYAGELVALDRIDPVLLMAVKFMDAVVGLNIFLS